jgi:hypothetical protein
MEGAWWTNLSWNKWAESFMKRNNYVKRKGTKAAKSLPRDFPAVRDAFVLRIKDQCTDHIITDEELININIDRTAVCLTPSSDYTLNKKVNRLITQ